MYRRVVCDVSTAGEPLSTAELVLLTPAADDGPPAAMLPEGADPPLAEAVAAAVRRPECRGACGELTTVDLHDGRRLLLLGLGKLMPPDHQPIRRAAAALLEGAHRLALSRLRWCVDGGAWPGEIDLPHALGEGLGLAAFRFDRFKAKSRHTAPEQFALVCDDADLAVRLRDGLALAESANLARRLADTPPNIATPANLADEARQLAQDVGLTCRVYADDELHRRDMVGLINVGKASEHKPCLIELIYEPSEPAPSARPLQWAGKRVQTLALVGKTITFDAGGLSLKVNDTMRHMKYDKAAGCAVLGAMHAIARLTPESRPACRVVGLLPAAENAISDKAYRVDDILQFPNGVSVDVANTDFEGRLVLADALIHACKQHHPDVLIDMGTLTGEIIEALGHDTAGLWCDNADLRDRLVAAGERAGEPVWPMPLNDEHRRSIEAAHADVVNIALDKPGKPCQCAAFLSHFVTPGMRWAHLDIAGPVHVERPTPPFEIGATGYGTRLLHALLA